MIFLLLKGPRVTGFGTRELRPETRFQPRLPSENQLAPCAPAARHPRERSDSVRRAASPAPARGAGAERGAASHAPREGDVLSGSGSEDGLRGSRKRQGPRALAAAGRRAGLRPGPSARPGDPWSGGSPSLRRWLFRCGTRGLRAPVRLPGVTREDDTLRTPPPLRTPHLVPAPSAPSRGRRTGQQVAPQAFLLRPVGGEHARGPEAPRAGRGDAGPEGGGPGPPQRAGSWKHLESFEDATRGERHT